MLFINILFIFVENFKNPKIMKKITLFAFAFAALSLASCKKVRTCTCTDSSTTTTTNAGGSVTTTDPASTGAFVSTTKLSKKQIAGLCASGTQVDTDVTTFSGSTTTQVTTTTKSCTFK